MARIRRLSVVFLVLALIVAPVVATSVAERRKVQIAYEELREACEEKRLDDAYLMMTRDYRKRVSLSQFKEEGGPGEMFSLDAMDWVVVRTCDVWSESEGWMVGYIWTFCKEDGVWRCDGHGDTWYLD